MNTLIYHKFSKSFTISLILTLLISLPAHAKDHNPCGDFDAYINYEWKSKHPVPSTESSWGSFDILIKSNEEKTITLLNELLGIKYSKSSYQQQIRDLYQSLLDTKTRNQRGIQPLMKYFKMIDQARSFNDLLIINALVPGMTLPFEGSVFQDLMNSESMAFYLSASGLTLGDKEYYLSDDQDKAVIREGLKDYITTIEQLLGHREKKAKRISDDIFNIEKDIANYHYNKEDSRDPFKMYNKFSLKEIEQLIPSIDWNRYFMALNISPDEVIITNPELLKSMDKIGNNHSLKSWKEYLKFHLASNMSSYLTEDFEKARFILFATIMNGVQEQKPVQDRAINRINNLLGESVGRLFISKHFSTSSKEKVEHMIENMRSVFAERIQNLEWMSNETKKEALEKLSSFTYKIGYPNKWKDESSIDIQELHVFENVMNIKNFRHKENLKEYSKEVDRDKWEMNAHEVNAYYHPLHNEIVFPAGILQPPFFDPEGDDAANYGGIGAVIGHEFSHGFDDQGSKFDADGNLRDWWAPKDRELFNNLTQKLEEQYNNYEILPGVHLNGKYTLGENIADQGGLLLGYYALLKEYENQPEPALVNGMDFKQRFFYGWAKVWRQNATDEFIKQLISTNPHAPAKARINVAISNLKEFYDAFNCDAPSETDRVIIW